jgi:hypothetical protein
MVAMSSSEIASRARRRRTSAPETESLDNRCSSSRSDWPAIGAVARTRKIEPGFQHKLGAGFAGKNWLASRMRSNMIRRRNRRRPPLTFQERLSKFAQDARAVAKALPRGVKPISDGKRPRRVWIRRLHPAGYSVGASSASENRPDRPACRPCPAGPRVHSRRPATASASLRSGQIVSAQSSSFRHGANAGSRGRFRRILPSAMLSFFDSGVAETTRANDTRTKEGHDHAPRSQFSTA